jgi:hypothetical protein
VHWHVAPDLEVSDPVANSVSITDPSRTHGHLLELVALGDGVLRPGTSWRSEVYGARRMTPELTFTSKGSGRQQAVAVLIPAPAHARPRVAPEGCAALDIMVGSRRDVVLRRGAAATLDVSGFTTDAECAVVTSSGGEDERLFLLGASFVEGQGLARQAVVRGALYSAQREGGRWVARPIQDRSPE